MSEFFKHDYVATDTFRMRTGEEASELTLTQLKGMEVMVSELVTQLHNSTTHLHRYNGNFRGKYRTLSLQSAISLNW